MGVGAGRAVDRLQVEESFGGLVDVFQLQEVRVWHDRHSTASFFRPLDFLGRSLAARHQVHRAIRFSGVEHRPVKVFVINALCAHGDPDHVVTVVGGIAREADMEMRHFCRLHDPILFRS